jgi:hypothetical protein
MAENNSELIKLLNQKKQELPDKDIMVRIDVFDKNTCLDFEYFHIDDLIIRLTKNEIFLRPEDLMVFIEK